MIEKKKKINPIPVFINEHKLTETVWIHIKKEKKRKEKKTNSNSFSK